LNVTTATDKQGSKLVRWAAVEAVQKTPADAGWLVARRHQLAARRGANIATVATARKLLTLVYYALRDGHVRALSSRPRPPSSPHSRAVAAASA
jgi:transposase